MGERANVSNHRDLYGSRDTPATAPNLNSLIGEQIFKLVLFARRPLKVLELQHALAIQDLPETLTPSMEEPFNDSLVMNMERRIIHCGRNLVETRGHRGIFLSYIHITVYLIAVQNLLSK